MNDELGYVEKIDQIRRRTSLSFIEARDLLEETDWDLLEALTVHEKRKNTWGNQVVVRVKELFAEGNKTKIVVKANDDKVMEIPVTVGVLGAALAPKIALLGAATCLLTRCSMQIQRQSNYSTGEFKVSTEGESD